MEIQGVIIKRLPRRQGTSARTGKTWEVQEYVLQTREQYPKSVLFQVFGADKIDNFHIQEGEFVKISFDIIAKEWNDRWFNTITAYKVERPEGEQQAPTNQPPAQSSQATPPPSQPQSSQQPASDGEKSDDLPF